MKLSIKPDNEQQTTHSSTIFLTASCLEKYKNQLNSESKKKTPKKYLNMDKWNG